MAAAEFHVAELLRDTQGGRVVGAQLSSGALQIEVVEEVAVEGQRGVPAVSLSPLIRIDDEVLEVRAGRALDSTHPRSGKPDQTAIGLDRPQHGALLLRLLFEPLLPRRRHRRLVPDGGHAPHAHVRHPA